MKFAACDVNARIDIGDDIVLPPNICPRAFQVTIWGTDRKVRQSSPRKHPQYRIDYLLDLLGTLRYRVGPMHTLTSREVPQLKIST